MMDLVDLIVDFVSYLTLVDIQPSYVSPEILKNIPYDESCDMWSVGVVLFVMLCGYTPFMDEDQEKMLERIKQGRWTFDEEDWSHVSGEAKDLISSLLQTNPDKRATATEALNSKWINKDTKDLSSRDLSQSLLSIREKRPRLKDLARAFMALTASAKNALGDINPLETEEASHHLT
jgi:serine/threonine protein kinase